MTIRLWVRLPQHADVGDVFRLTQPDTGKTLNPRPAPVRYNSQVSSRANSPIYPSMGG